MNTSLPLSQRESYVLTGENYILRGRVCSGRDGGYVLAGGELFSDKGNNGPVANDYSKLYTIGPVANN